MNVLVVDDEATIRESLKKFLSLGGIDATVAGDGAMALKLLSEQSFDAIVLDLRLPGMTGQEILEWIQTKGIRAPVVMISAHGEISDAVAALKSGASDYLTKPFDPDELTRRLTALVASRRSEDMLEAGKRTATGEVRLVGGSPAMRELASQIERVAGSDSTVLVTGESGTGKEVVARELHARGSRAEEPFVAVNIGGIHESLMESELFGHEKGSFTGATSRKVGLFELAGNGTLFLDEIGEMPPNLQVKLLRVLQERKIRRLGGTADLPVRARIVSATNRDIEAMVRSGSFREDLYYRLNVVRLLIPPLRERVADVPDIANYLVARIAARMNRPPRPIEAEAMDALRSYPFPGNVRELENVIERALIYCRGDRITLGDIDLRDRGVDRLETNSPRAAGSACNAASAEPAAISVSAPAPTHGASIDTLERDAIVAALARHAGNRTHAAEELGISRRTIINKIRAYGLA
jgi:two-component system, NtrC family, response regulator AtoC